MVEWKVRLYQDGDEEQIVDLLNLELMLDAKLRGEETKAKTYTTDSWKTYAMDSWLWNFKNDPYGFLTAVGEHKGKIIGIMSLFYFDMKLGDKIIRTSQGSALFVHPDFRRQGMFLEIGRTLLETSGKRGVPLAFCFPNKIAADGHVKYGWFFFSMVPVMTTYFDISRTVKARGIPLSGLVSKAINYYYSRKRRHKIPSDDVNIKKITRFDKRIDNFWNRVAKQHEMITVRDSKYLNWRYFDKPKATYEVFVAEKEGQIEGYLVTNKLQNESVNVGWIIDVLCISKNVFLNLVHYAVDHLQKYSVDSIKCLMNDNKSEYKWIQETGFTSYPRPKLRMIARINSEEVADSFRVYSKDWYVTYGDCDFM